MATSSETSFLRLWLASLAGILRDKGAVLLLFGAPVLYGFFYPWFYSQEVVQRVPVAVVVQDNSSLARQMLRFAQASPRIDPQLVTADEGEARAAVLRGDVMGYALLPRDLKRDVIRRAKVVVPVYANGAYPLVSKQVQYGFAEAFGTVSAGVEIKRLQAGGQSAAQAAVSRSPVNVQAVALFNPTEGYGSFVVAAVAVLILQQTLLMGSAMLVGTWREQGQDRVGPRQWLARMLALCVPGWLAGLFYFGWIFIWQDLPHGGNPWPHWRCWPALCPPWLAMPAWSAGGWLSGKEPCKSFSSLRFRWRFWQVLPGRSRPCPRRCSGCAGSRPAQRVYRLR